MTAIQPVRVARGAMILFAAMAALIAVVAIFYSRCSRASFRTEMADASGVALAARVKKLILQAQAEGKELKSCQDFDCEQVLPDFKLPDRMRLDMVVDGNSVSVRASHDVARKEAVWDISQPDKIEQTEID